MKDLLRLPLIFAVIAGFFFYAYEYILRIIPSVMASEFSLNMHVNAGIFGALSAYYYYAYTPFQLAVGIIFDKYKVKYTLTIASLFCILGTILITFSQTKLLYAIGRFIQGGGSAFAWVGILKLAALFLPKRFFGLAASFGSVFGFVGAAFGQVTISYLVQEYGGHTTLIALIIGGFILTFFLYVSVSRAYRITNFVVEKNQHNHSRSFKELLAVFKKPYIWAAGIIAALLFTPTTVFAELWGVTYLSKVYSYSNVQASFITSMIFIGWAIGAALSGVLTVFINNQVKLIRYGALGAFILSLLILYCKIPYEILGLLCILFGILSSVEVLAFVMGYEAVNPELAGMAGASVNLICTAVGVGFQLLAGILLDKFWQGAYNNNGLREYPLFAYKYSVLFIPLVLLICFIFTFFIDVKQKKFKFFWK